MKDTLIQWCDSTVSPTTGCSGCELFNHERKSCYAGVMHERRLAKTLPNLYAKDFLEVRLAPGRMAKAAAWPDLTGQDRPDKPWLNGMPRVIFVSDMSDALSQGVPFQYLRDEIVEVVESPAGRRHIWMWLTKQPYRMECFARTLDRWPANLWAGTSVTTQGTTTRIQNVLKVPAARHFVSAEPMWESIDLHARELLCRDYPDGITVGKYLDLVILGGESGPLAKPFDVEWARSLVQQCRETKTAAFVKQLGAKPYRVEPCKDFDFKPVDLKLKDHHGGDWSEWPEDLRVREFPA